MILSHITLSHFRNYVKKTFEFSPQTTLIMGDNGSGKTNIIEAITMLASGKSFRAEHDGETIAWSEPIARISGDVGDDPLELVITRGAYNGRHIPTKKFLVNGIPRRSIDFAGHLKAVLFWPEDLELVIDSPSIRRRYLDRVLVQTDREYRRNLQSYEKGLRQRNKVLDAIKEGTASRNQLLFWDQLLIKAGGYITDSRTEYIDYVNSHQPSAVNNKPSAISYQQKRSVYRIEYDKSVISEARILQYAEAEVAAKATLVGPHRDDFTFMISFDEKKYAKGIDNDEYLSLSSYGSRGEQRLGVLWLKLAELSYIRDTTQDRPILLLDDILSELDENNRQAVLDLIKTQQTVITTAEDETEELLHAENIAYSRIKLSEI